MKLGFFNVRKPHKFRYQPRYYDEEKERMEERKRELGLAGSADGDNDFGARIANRWRYMREREAGRRRKSDANLLIYILILVLLLIFIFWR
jgi:hypothetical protein